MSKNRVTVIACSVAILICMLTLATQESQAGWSKRAIPSAMYPSDYEGSAAFAGGNMNSFLGYEGEMDTVYINPNRGARSPFSYRNWNRRRAMGRSALTGPLRGFEGEGNGFGYSSCPTEGSYEQDFMAGCCGDVVVGDCCDPCFYDPCCDPCVEMMPVRRSCGFFSSLKSIFSMKKSFCCSKFARDPWYACDPCGFNMCCDPCCDPCGGFFGGAVATGSCCGASDDSSVISDGMVTGDVNVESAPGAASAVGSGTAPTPLDSLRTDPVTKPGAFAPKTDQISVPSYPSVPAPNAPANLNAPANPAAPGAPANPAAPGAPVGGPAAPGPLKSGSTGVIKMTVPEDSIVYINGYRTKMKGAQRSFNANNLEDGQSYNFEVRVVAAINGQLVEEVKETTLVGGLVSSLAFMQNSDKVSTVALK